MLAYEKLRKTEAEFFIACSFSVPLIVAALGGFSALLFLMAGKGLSYLNESFANVEYIGLFCEYSQQALFALGAWGAMCFFSLIFYPLYLILAAFSVFVYKKVSTKIRVLWAICLPLMMVAPFMWNGGRLVVDIDIASAVLIVGYTNVAFFLVLLRGARKNNQFCEGAIS